MKNLVFTLPWGRLIKTRSDSGIFKGDPTKYAQALIAANHGKAVDALLFLDRQVPAQTADAFYRMTRNYIMNRINGFSRKNRAARLAAGKPAPAAT